MIYFFWDKFFLRFFSTVQFTLPRMEYFNTEWNSFLWFFFLIFLMQKKGNDGKYNVRVICFCSFFFFCSFRAIVVVLVDPSQWNLEVGKTGFIILAFLEPVHVIVDLKLSNSGHFRRRFHPNKRCKGKSLPRDVPGKAIP